MCGLAKPPWAPTLCSYAGGVLGSCLNPADGCWRTCTHVALCSPTANTNQSAGNGFFVNSALLMVSMMVNAWLCMLLVLVGSIDSNNAGVMADALVVVGGLQLLQLGSLRCGWNGRNEGLHMQTHTHSLTCSILPANPHAAACWCMWLRAGWRWAFSRPSRTSSSSLCLVGCP
jgi:hypothetical protein